MTPELVFTIVSVVSAITWLLLIVLPRKSWVTLVAGTAVPLVFAAVYGSILAVNVGRGPGGFSSLADVALLFSNPWALLAGWIHYLAFDLLVGVWEVHDSSRRGLPHLLVVPCLVLTFFFGPAGWLLYQAVRRSRSAPA